MLDIKVVSKIFLNKFLILRLEFHYVIFNIGFIKKQSDMEEEWVNFQNY